MLVNFVKHIYGASYEIGMERRYDTWTSNININTYINRYKGGRFIIEELICTRDLNKSTLTEGDKIYDKELCINFNIIEFIRNTDDTYTCVVDYEIEDDEESLCRKYELEKEMLRTNEIIDDLRGQIDNLGLLLKEEKSKSIWQLIKERWS